jgi:protein tyrosine/serine phosphatase
MSKQINAALSRRRTWLAAVAVTLSLAGAAYGQQASPGIKNFGRVNENYYRGAQPEAGQYAELRRAGIKTVIDLRADRQHDARERARAAGLAYFNLPLEAGAPATDEQTAAFLRLVNDPANWPVYVHCKGGRHHTGAMTAAYRITHDGWTADRAFEEMLKYDFNDGSDTVVPFGGDGRARQKWFVYAFYESYATSQDPARAN